VPSSMRIMEAQSIQRNSPITYTAPSAIYVRGLTKRFAVGAAPALDAVDLDVPNGAIHGVLGLSGAGKSTLLRCIARLEKPDAGEIVVAGRDWTSLAGAQLRRERGKMGIVFQQLHLLSSRTVAANVALPLELYGMPRAEIVPRVTELLGWFGIAEKARDYPTQLSGGQRQRVALARALATKPRVLLADEPTSALDPETRASALSTLRGIRDQLGVTILIITHDLRSAAGICDSLTVLDAGRVVESGSASEVLDHPSTEVTQRLLAHSGSPLAATSQASALHFEELGQP
jgi:D-methionine transport system ATP-binding protein